MERKREGLRVTSSGGHYYSYHIQKFSEPVYKRTGKYLPCETCGQRFYVQPSRIRQAKRQNARIRFCSDECRGRVGANNSFYGKRHTQESVMKMVSHRNRRRFSSESNPNLRRFGDGFIGRTGPWWRRYLRKVVGKCERCGWNLEKNVLQIHHKDRDRKHNERKNLELLCPTCHELEHYRKKDGGYLGNRSRRVVV